MSQKKSPPWFSIVGGLVGCLTLLGIIFGNVVAYGRQQAKQEEVVEKVEKLDEAVEEHDQELQKQMVQQQLIQQDLGYLKEGIKQLLERKR